MKRLFLITLIFFVGLIRTAAQDSITLKSIQEKMVRIDYKGTFVNDSIVKKLIYEYQYEADKYGLDLTDHIDNINWILIEPEFKKSSEFKGFELSKIDKKRRLILLSRICLIDTAILQIELFKQLSHYLGVPYNTDDSLIMSLERPEGYTHGWIQHPLIQQAEYKKLFELVSVYLTNP